MGAKKTPAEVYRELKTRANAIKAEHGAILDLMRAVETEKNEYGRLAWPEEVRSAALNMTANANRFDFFIGFEVDAMRIALKIEE